MSDEEKALAIWRPVVMFRHQNPPPKELLEGDGCVHDSIKVFNVYGYNMCRCAASNIAALARYIEVQWDGERHMLGASLINYFLKPNGKIASVDKIIAEVKAWYDAHPEYRNNEAKLRELHRQDGWSGWKRGPTLLANCPFYDQYGWLPAKTHGWYSTMLKYDGSVKFLYEPGYSLGYRVNNQLRPGKRLVLIWFNKGLHVNMKDGEEPSCLRKRISEDDLAYARDYGDIAPGGIGNGVREYDVPLADGTFKTGMLVAENLICRAEAKTKMLLPPKLKTQASQRF